MAARPTRARHTWLPAAPAVMIGTVGVTTTVELPLLVGLASVLVLVSQSVAEEAVEWAEGAAEVVGTVVEVLPG